MGLSNSPGTFQRLMDLVLRGMTWSSVLVYIDDIVVYGRSFDTLWERLKEVFERLRKANLKLKPSKVKLFQREITFLGHIVSSKGIAMDPEKVKEVTDWKTPANAHEVRQFLGLCSYYRKFVKNFSLIASPLQELTRKEEPFLWAAERQTAFETLKGHLVTGPILVMSREEGDFVLDVDASNWAAGAVQQQEKDGQLKVIGYASGTFDKCEIRYCITRKELAALIFGLKHYRQYLLGRTFKVRSDHAALRYLRSATELIGQQGRWLATLEEFNFQLDHRAGLLHGNADSMSRKTPCEEGGEPCPQCSKWRPVENITDEDFTMDNGQQYLSCFATHSTGALEQGTEVESLSVSTGAMKQGPGLETPITSTGAMKQGPGLETPITSTGAMKQGPGLETPITSTGAMKQGPGLETP